MSRKKQNRRALKAALDRAVNEGKAGPQGRPIGVPNQVPAHERERREHIGMLLKTLYMIMNPGETFNVNIMDHPRIMTPEAMARLQQGIPHGMISVTKPMVTMGGMVAVDIQGEMMAMAGEPETVEEKRGEAPTWSSKSRLKRLRGEVPAPANDVQESKPEREEKPTSDILVIP
jgi:hypothetical protein